MGCVGTREEAEKLGAGCSGCPLNTQPFVPSKFVADPEMMIIGEAPGANEVEQGEPFVGQSGQLLRHTLRKVGQDDSRVSLTNAVSCRPPGNRDPLPFELRACMPRLLYELEQHKGVKVVTVGKVAREVLEYLSHVPTTDKVSLARGFWHHCERLDSDWIATWHPAYVLRDPGKFNEMRMDLSKARIGRIQTVEDAPPRVLEVEGAEELARVLSTVRRDEVVGMDIESDNTQWYDRPTQKADAVLMLGLSWSDDACLVLSDMQLYDDPACREVINRFLADNRQKTLHNGKFDRLFLRSIGIHTTVDFDTMLAHFTLDETPGTHGLKDIAHNYFGIHDYEQEHVQKYLNNRNDRYSKVPFDSLAQYLAYDCVVTRKARRHFEDLMIQQGLLDDPFYNLLMPAQDVLTESEWWGMKVDVEYMRWASDLIQEDLDDLTSKMRAIAHDDGLNLNAPGQVAHVLYDVLGLPMPRGRKIKPRSTDKNALFHLKGRHPFVDMLIQYRRAAKIKSSYMDNLIPFLDTQGFVHCDFRVMGTEVGRLAVRDPALQTVPRPEDPKKEPNPRRQYGRLIRAAYMADSEDETLVVCDHSQAELRALGALSGEPFLIRAYNEDRDLHTEVALAMFGENYSKDDRVLCKMFNFSWVYGGSEYSFAEDSGLNINQARQFVKQYERNMPIAVAWKQEQFRLAKTRGWVGNPFGRRRRFPLITQEIADDVRKASCHMPCASTASDLNLFAAIRLIREGFKVKLLVHDSVLTSVLRKEADEAEQYISETMRRVAQEKIPNIKWKVDSEQRDRWCAPPAIERNLLV